MVATPGRMSRSAPLRLALREAGEVVQVGAAERSAVDTGLMRRSISVRQGVNRKYYVSVFVGVTKRAWYWKFVEFGTSRMAAQPFMRPALIEEGPEALARFERRFPEIVRASVAS